ncbi:MAG: hypothetical protein LBW85_01545 [Deltaproteobacteria bacterium]|jgi:hypothetical protein|nr:hypothetical protein [Deltaproteobacteria bacterium]
MSYIFTNGKDRNRYLYLGESYRDSEGAPRNSRVRVGVVDSMTGVPVYIDEFVGKDVWEGIEISPELKGEIIRQDRFARKTQPWLFGEEAREIRRQSRRRRRGWAPLYSLKGLRTIPGAEGGIFALIEWISREGGFTEALKDGLPGNWEDVFALACFLFARERSLKKARKWCQSFRHASPDLSRKGVRAIIGGIDPAGVRAAARAVRRRNGPEPPLLYEFGPARLYLKVGGRTYLPLFPASRGPLDRRGELAVVRAFLREKAPASMSEILKRSRGHPFVCRATCEVPEVAARAEAHPEGGRFRGRPNDSRRKRPVSILLEKPGPGQKPPEVNAAVSDYLVDPECALLHLNLCEFLDGVRREARRRLSARLGADGLAGLRRKAAALEYVTLSLAAQVWKFWAFTPAMRYAPNVDVLAGLADARRVTFGNVRYVKTPTLIQKEFYLAFGVRRWEMETLLGLPCPFDPAPEGEDEGQGRAQAGPGPGGPQGGGPARAGGGGRKD